MRKIERKKKEVKSKKETRQAVLMYVSRRVRCDVNTASNGDQHIDRPSSEQRRKEGERDEKTAVSIAQ
jgi:hypothetical protein